MGRERLSDLMMPSIESDLVKSLSYDDLITNFAGKRARKGCLFFCDFNFPIDCVISNSH